MNEAAPHGKLLDVAKRLSCRDAFILLIGLSVADELCAERLQEHQYLTNPDLLGQDTLNLKLRMHAEYFGRAEDSVRARRAAGSKGYRSTARGGTGSRLRATMLDELVISSLRNLFQDQHALSSVLRKEGCSPTITKAALRRASGEIRELAPEAPTGRATIEKRPSSEDNGDNDGTITTAIRKTTLLAAPFWPTAYHRSNTIIFAGERRNKLNKSTHLLIFGSRRTNATGACES